MNSKINLIFFFSIQKNVLYQDTLFSALNILKADERYNIKLYDPHGIAYANFPSCIYISDINQLIVESENSLIFVSYYQDIDFLLHNIDSSNHFKIINLWHGMPLRNINLLDPIESELEVFNTINLHKNKIFHFVYEKPYIDVFSLAFNAISNHIFDIGNLRFTSTPEQFANEYSKNILFAPSFDKYNSYVSISERIGINCSDHELNEFLKINSFSLHVKLHNLEIPIFIKENFSNIIFIDQFKLDLNKIQLSLILDNFDLLISDFSSLIVDYLYYFKPVYINKPLYLNPSIIDLLFSEQLLFSESTNEFSLFKSTVISKLSSQIDDFSSNLSKTLNVNNNDLDFSRLHNALHTVFKL